MSEPTSLPLTLSRRRLLQGMAVLSLSALTASLFPQQAAARTQETQAFQQIAAFLVSRPVSPVLSARYFAALNRRVADFSTRFSTLARYLETQRFTHVDDLARTLAVQDPRRQTASLIVAAWYTGVVGEGADRELIAYADAMMYLPTRGVLVIPTYGGGPDSWGSKPDDPQITKGEE
ncbi:sugar dehydrogenase complex small subunit [Erwinia sp. ErVv1]|uniref:sugar dehydrogenase complex small subunit n=1 Tax=Erwinia sp. ErVv1 TaxID=1603299 RepID=UPI0008358CAA|nr:sugar dehydrogenase complex small subunit [Erwinia sp. ErVv1]